MGEQQQGEARQEEVRHKTPWEMPLVLSQSFEHALDTPDETPPPRTRPVESSGARSGQVKWHTDLGRLGTATIGGHDGSVTDKLSAKRLDLLYEGPDLRLERACTRKGRDRENVRCEPGAQQQQQTASATATATSPRRLTLPSRVQEPSLALAFNPLVPLLAPPTESWPLLMCSICGAMRFSSWQSPWKTQATRWRLLSCARGTCVRNAAVKSGEVSAVTSSCNRKEEKSD